MIFVSRVKTYYSNRLILFEEYFNFMGKVCNVILNTDTYLTTITRTTRAR